MSCLVMSKKGLLMSLSPTVLATDAGWSWTTGVGEAHFRLSWQRPEEAERHRRRLDEAQLARQLFPFRVLPCDDGGCRLQLSSAGAPPRPLSTVLTDGLPPLKLTRVLEELGRWLRALHDLPSPDGFGDPEAEPRLQTINAFLSQTFAEMTQELTEREALNEEKLQSLADLRNELSGFHPHGRTSWTLGRITPGRLAVDPTTGAIVAFMDLGQISLRPPEWDLAALRVSRLLPARSLSERAFFRGYGAALTRDLERRVHYFERLLTLLVAPLHHEHQFKANTNEGSEA